MQTFSMARRHASAIIIALSVVLPGITGAAMLKTDAGKSNITAIFKQMNVPVDARFKKFSAQIDYNGDAPEKSKASIELDIASFDLGDAEYNKEVQKKEWFNAAQFPKATFVSSSIKAGAAGKLDVSGKLTIKGKSADVSFPLSVKKDGANNVFEGSLPIKRLAYNIGEGEWKDTSMVGDEIVIKFRVVAAQ
jgi:polyisoprenoid-binding protein YceI